MSKVETRPLSPANFFRQRTLNRYFHVICPQSPTGNASEKNPVPRFDVEQFHARLIWLRACAVDNNAIPSFGDRVESLVESNILHLSRIWRRGYRRLR